MAVAYGHRRKWRSLECRGNDPERPGVSPSLCFYGHVIDLKQGQQCLLKSFDGAVRRGILKAGREGLRVRFSNCLDSVRTFYALHCATRRRHGLPPQPFRFFENITRHVLARGHGFVATAHREGKPLAAAVFFHHGRQAFYKFSASDYAYQGLRPNNAVLWEAINRFVDGGFDTIHLGRTSLTNDGLRRFKLGFGALEETIEYYKYDFGSQTFVSQIDRSTANFTALFRCMPVPILRLAGEMIYPHLS
jgi:lipid II:glycine glycyltransferase (peptidoglycan interpeptide bridge formation enzyme)